MPSSWCINGSQAGLSKYAAWRQGRIIKLMHRDGRCCFYCRTLVGLSDVTIDEFVPVGLGGARTLENQRLACLPCNGAKTDLFPTDEVLACLAAREYDILRTVERAVSIACWILDDPTGSRAALVRSRDRCPTCRTRRRVLIDSPRRGCPRCRTDAGLTP